MAAEPTTREMDQLWNRIDGLDTKIDKILEQVTATRVKTSAIAAVLGFIGGAIPVTIAVLMKILK